MNFGHNAAHMAIIYHGEAGYASFQPKNFIADSTKFFTQKSPELFRLEFLKFFGIFPRKTIVFLWWIC